MLYWADSAQDGFAQLGQRDFDLVLLSLALSDRDGLEVCREITSKYSSPVVVLSAMASLFDEVSSLEAGADEFLVKPLQPAVTLARIRALLRRTNRSQDEQLKLGDLFIDRPQLTASHEGRSLPLTPTEFKILAQLAMADGLAVSRQDIIDSVWEADEGCDLRIVDSHVRNLRRKLMQSGTHVSIQGVRGVGYQVSSNGVESCLRESRPEPFTESVEKLHSLENMESS